MNLYNSIPTNIKPPIVFAKLHFVDSFDSNFALLLRERKYANLEIMIKYFVEVEVNLIALGKMKHRT